MMRSPLRCCTSIIRSSALVQASSSLSIGRTCAWPRRLPVTEMHFRHFSCELIIRNSSNMQLYQVLQILLASSSALMGVCVLARSIVLILVVPLCISPYIHLLPMNLSKILKTWRQVKIWRFSEYSKNWIVNLIDSNHTNCTQNIANSRIFGQRINTKGTQGVLVSLICLLVSHLWWS